jgi:hypothetical protein
VSVFRQTGRFESVCFLLKGSKPQHFAVAHVPEMNGGQLALKARVAGSAMDPDYGDDRVLSVDQLVDRN